MLPLIKCWTVLRHIAHRPHHHIRRIGHHIVAHKAVAVAVPVIVCTSLGGAGWMLPAAPGAFGGESGAFGSGGSGSAENYPFAAGGFAGSAVAPALELPAEFFAAPLLGPITLPSGAPVAIETIAGAPGIPNVPGVSELPATTPETPAQPIPEPTSLAVFAAALAALWVAKRLTLSGRARDAI